MNRLLASTGPVNRALAAVLDRIHSRVVSAHYGFTGHSTGRVAFIVYFSAGPVDAYQLQQWLLPLERLADAVGPGLVVLSNPRTAALVRRETSLDILLTHRSDDIDGFISQHAVQLVFYVNNNQSNFTVLRNNGPKHIHLSHGESEKSSMVSNQLKAYDYAMIAGQAARERIRSRVSGLSNDHLIEIGRPQLDRTGTADFPPTVGRRVLYAPTWEGDGPAMAYGSLASVGSVIVDAFLAAPDMQLIFRPHPRSGTHSRSHAAALKNIRQSIEIANKDSARTHIIDQGSDAVLSIRAADVVIADISAMAMDAVGLHVPLALTPADAQSHGTRGDSPLRDAVPTLDTSTSDSIADKVRDLARAAPSHDQANLASYVFGPCPSGGYTGRFVDAVKKILG